MPGFELWGDEERKEVNEVLETGILMRYGFDGPRKGVYKSIELEKAICQTFGCTYAQLTSSGTGALTTALAALGIQGITVTEVKGHGRQKGHTEFYRGAEYAVSFVPKIKIEVAIESSMADKVIEAIQSAGQTGQIGDGKIFMLPLELALRVRTGETGPAAL